MAKKKNFYHVLIMIYDLSLKNLLVGQAKNDDSPFEITDMSIKAPIIDEDWKKNARRRIKGCDVVVVICGEHTDTATGVSAELHMLKMRVQAISCLKVIAIELVTSQRLQKQVIKCTGGHGIT